VLTIFGQQFLNGLVVGSLYCLIALGLTLIYGVLFIPNFSHGELYMLGSYVGFFLCTLFGINYWISLILSTLVMGIVGLIIERLVFWPMRDAPHVNFFMAALGIIMFLQGFIFYFVGGQPKFLNTSYSQSTLVFAGLYITEQRLLIILITIAVVVLLQLFIKKTTTGAAIEAASQDREGAFLVGIKPASLSALSFIIGVALAGFAGVLVAPAVVISPTMGFVPVVIAFAVIIVGGIGSLPGAVIAAYAIGMIQALFGGYISATFSETAIYAVLIGVLLFRPRGIMGKKEL
jgi:branched-chain amino acid transport system permease protein